MKAAFEYTSTILGLLLRLSCAGGELDFHFSAGFGDPKSQSITLRLGYDDPAAIGERIVRRYEQMPESLDQQDKIEAFRYYMAKLRFVEAENLARDLAKAGNPRGEFALGMAKLCRGDYEGARISLKSAEESGIRQAVYIRIYVTCLVLHRATEVRGIASNLVEEQDYNKSAMAASAVIAFCLVADGGKQTFDAVSAHIKRELLFSDDDTLTLYLAACKLYGKEQEVRSLKEEYETRKARVPK